MRTRSPSAGCSRSSGSQSSSTLAGEEGPQAERIRAQAEKIARSCGLPLEFADERLSSAEAKRILKEQGLSERAMRGKVDSVAAGLFLQSWLDARQI